MKLPPKSLPRLEDIPGALPDNKRLRRQRNLPTRVPRRPEEDIPRADYVQYMETLGPRSGESFLAYRKRMCVIEGIRLLWLAVWRQFGGIRSDVVRAMGIPDNNLAGELRSVGLTIALLGDAALGRIRLT